MIVVGLVPADVWPVVELRRPRAAEAAEAATGLALRTP
mgnify:CR=1 FL=1